MGDWTLTIDGNASGATAALQEVGKEQTLLYQQATAQGDAQRKKSEEFWGSVTKYAAAAAAAVAAFGVASVKAFMEAEKVSKQLTRAAGEYADVIERQASALQEKYAVDDDIIKQSSTLLAQWNGVGSATKETTEAILDYAAATGQDAVSATQELIRNVESGGVGMAKLGVHYDATGEKTEDLRRLTAALANKFGGAAQADKDSLHGQVTAVGLAFSDLQETIGGSIAKFLQQHDVAGKLTEALRGMQTLLGGGDVNEANAKNEDLLATFEALNGRLERRKELAKQAADFETAGSKVAADAIRALSAENEKGIAMIRTYLAERNALMSGSGLPAAEGGDTNKGMKDGDAALKAAETQAAKLATLHEKNVEEWKKYLQGIDDLEEASRVKDQDNYADELELSAKRVTDAEKESAERTKIRRDMLLQIEKDNAEHAEKMAKDEAKALEKAAKDTADRAAKKAEEARQVGDQIGAAFVNALTDQLSKLASGGEFDAALFVGDILATVVGVAGSVIGTALGNPAVGAAVGNLAATGIRFGASEISKGAKYNGARKAHAGGWVGELPAYHDGGWVNPNEQLAVLRRDERVLTPEEVHHMGGRGAVDNMARGGGHGPTFNVTAIDAKSFADTMTGSGGDGLKQALRRGHGALPALLGKSPR